MVIWLLLTITAALLYRMGGMGDEGRKKYPGLPTWAFDSKARDVGVPTCMVIGMVAHHGFHWSLLLCFGLLFGSLTTYWKKKGTDAEWYNWVLTGLGYSIAMLPYAMETGHWLGFVLRTIYVTLIVTLVSELSGDDDTEELSRGAAIIAFLPLL